VKTYVFRVVLEPDGDRWLAYAPALKDLGGATWGDTEAEALQSIKEVVQMTVEGLVEHSEPIPEEPQSDVLVLPEPRVAVTL
jgi:predicted RNase H-like HicB family nuclease